MVKGGNMKKNNSSQGFLRIGDVLKFIPIGRSTWWSWVKSGRAPKPIKLSAKITVWKKEDIYLFIAKQTK